MSQESVTQGSSTPSQGNAEPEHDKSSLGPLLCWAVVFADIGTSVYYTPGILYQTVHSLAGFFVFLTMSVFVLLTLKYAEVTQRFPQGGGVVTVAAQALNHWVGAVGGMFILVDYFLTAAISSLSGMLYLSVVFTALAPPFVSLSVTIGVLVLLGILNWFGISESAKVSLVGAIIAFVSDLAILVTVFTHISLLDFIGLVGEMFSKGHLTGTSLLIGFAGSFLAFSGLESISQLSPVMKTPRSKVASRALLMVVLTIGITSPLLTILSTLLLPSAAADANQSAQIISLLAGHWGNIVLQTEVAISASALLVFASNTAIIGAYHVFLALARMDFFPEVVLQRNRLRGTPHYAILIATGIPIIVLVAVNGRIDILGDMYAFGLLGAFSLTCLGLDVIRYRERRNAHRLLKARERGGEFVSGSEVESTLLNGFQSDGQTTNGPLSTSFAGSVPVAGSISSASANGNGASSMSHDMVEPEFSRENILGAWPTTDYVLGIITTVLVLLAWGTNLVAKPLATIFGGAFSLLGMGVAYLNYRQHERGGRTPVVITGIEGRMPDAILALLTGNENRDLAVVQSAVSESGGHPIIFLYVSDVPRNREPQMFEVIDPYLDDTAAKTAFGRAEHKARNLKMPRRYIYRMGDKNRVPAVVSGIWQVVHPHDTIVSADDVAEFENINPDRVRYELTSQGKVAHLLKRW